MNTSWLRRRRVARGLGVLLAAGLAATVPLRGQDAPALETFDTVWRTVRDSHFDKTMNGVDWDKVATELRPRAAQATSAGDLRVVLRDMLGRLGQSHFAIIPGTPDSPADLPRDLSGNPGFDVRLLGRDLIVTQVTPGGGADRAGVKTGWKLLSADGTAMPGLLATLSDALELRLLEVEAWRLAQSRLRGPSGSPGSFAFVDGADRTVALAIQREPERGEPVTVGSLPTMFVRVEARAVETPARRTAGVVAFNVWMTAVDARVTQAVDDFRSASGFVIDLRGNPGGLAAMLMGTAGHFIDERKPLGVMKVRDNELTFTVNPRRVNGRGERVAPFAGPVAILVDGLSGSASECFAGGMQSLGRVRVFGQRTMGQALPALFARLPNGDVLIHAFGDFVTSDGTRLEGRGVIPDEVIPLDRADLLQGRDRTMQAALEWVDRTAAAESHRPPR